MDGIDIEPVVSLLLVLPLFPIPIPLPEVDRDEECAVKKDPMLSCLGSEEDDTGDASDAAAGGDDADVVFPSPSPSSSSVLI